MPARVSILPGGRDFTIDGHDSILEGALRAGVPLNYGCSGGNCGLCKARLVSGEIREIHHHDYVLTEAEKSRGCLLMCCNTAVTDVEIEASVAGGVQDIPFQQIAAKVRSVSPLNPEVALLHLQTPRTSRLRFLAGQSVKLRVGEDVSGVLPIASCPCDDRNLLFHVRRTPGNQFVERLLNGLAHNDIVEVEGPQGEFILHERPSRGLCFVAFDTGFAPIKSLIEHALSLDTGERIFLYWIGSDEGSVYLPNVGRAWDDALDNFHYTERVAGYDLANLSAKGEEALEHMLHILFQCGHEAMNGAVYIAGRGSAIGVAEQFFLGMGVAKTQIFAADIQLG